MHPPAFIMSTSHKYDTNAINTRECGFHGRPKIHDAQVYFIQILSQVHHNLHFASEFFSLELRYFYDEYLFFLEEILLFREENFFTSSFHPGLVHELCFLFTDSFLVGGKQWSCNVSSLCCQVFCYLYFSVNCKPPKCIFSREKKTVATQ